MKEGKRATQDFEELLQSGATRNLSSSSRDLSALGRTQRRTRTRSASTGSDFSSRRTNSTASVELFGAKTDLLVPAASYETKRRSQFRSEGTDAVADVATLVRQTKERRAAEGEKRVSSPKEPSSPTQELSVTRSRTPPPPVGLLPEQFVRSRTKSDSPRPLSINSRRSAATGDSYVHVPTTGTDYGRRYSQPQPVMREEGNAHLFASKSFSNTVKKTSGLLKKMAGRRSNGPLTQIGTPSDQRQPPPVPAIPASYASPPRPRRTNSSDSESAARRIPSPAASPARVPSSSAEHSRESSQTHKTGSSQFSMDWVGTMAKIEADGLPELPEKDDASQRKPSGLTPIEGSPEVSFSESQPSPNTPTNDKSFAEAQDAPTPPAKDTAELGLGLALDPIKESHSREVSHSSDVALTPSSSSGKLPIITAQSPDPAPPRIVPLSISTTSPTPQKPRAKSRQSLVAYPVTPSAPASGMNASIGMSRSFSASSRISDAVPEDSTFEEHASLLASKCWDEDEAFLRKTKIAEWLGGHGNINQLALKQYLANFDFAGLRLDLAFRKLCEKLYLKAETQQIDRILAEFSHRYWANNPKTLFGSSDVVHIISYTLLLLNTDLHVVNSNTRMTRSQFVRNAMAGIEAAAGPASLSRSATPNSAFVPPLPSPIGGEELAIDTIPTRTSLDQAREVKTDRPRKLRRTNSASSSRSFKAPPLPGSAENLAMPTSSTSSSVAASPVTSPAKSRKLSMVPGESTAPVMSKAWQMDMETLLKDMYVAIRDKPVFQPLASSNSGLGDSSSLSPASPYATLPSSRAASRRSQVSLAAGSAASDRSKRVSLKGWLGPGSQEPMPARSHSPTPSTATSFSEGPSTMTAYGSSCFPPSPATAITTPTTIGFASNLSHSIIRESQGEQDGDETASGVTVTDAELALLGAPWAKEGNLKRKHYWDAPNRRSKDKEWLQVFVVIQRGELKMFRFGLSTKTSVANGLGGGDWTSNASLVGDLNLAHALCTAMPAPGYNKQRPHVFVLTLGSGSSYFFEAGTADLVHEWVSTCNYWAARQSSVPLTGGVSNMEYGWNRAQAVEEDDDDDESRSQFAEDRSDAKSIKSTRSRRSRLGSVANFSMHERGNSALGSSAVVNPNDRIYINTWQAPAPPNIVSSLPEEQQAEALKRYLKHLGKEAERHGEVRGAMMSLYSTRSSNLKKAQENWARKQQHLTEETVKFSTYHDALVSANRLRNARLAERTVADLLEQADEADVSPTLMQHTISPEESRPGTAASRPSTSTSDYVDASGGV